MRKIIIFMVALALSKMATAQYKPVDAGSALKFTIGNFGFDVNGSFSGLQGSIVFDPQNPSAGNFDVTIDAATVKTDNALRDTHLKGTDYFDVKNYARIHLMSAKITAMKSGVFTMTAHLTIKDKAKDITFPFSATTADDGYNFKGSFKINRKDFGVGGTSTIANELLVNLTVHAVKA